jgi:hypothetical protein
MYITAIFMEKGRFKKVSIFPNNSYDYVGRYHSFAVRLEFVLTKEELKFPT